MATLARRLLKIILFACLFFLSVRYVHIYPLPMTMEQQHILISFTSALNASDPEIVYMFSMLILNLIAAIVAYRLIMACLGWIHKKKHHAK